MKEKVMPNNSQVKLKKTEVKEHHRISSISKKTKSVTACNDSLKFRTSNVNVACATCGKYVFNSNHDACVLKFLNDVNARTKKPKVVPICTRKPKSQANKSDATPLRKQLHQNLLSRNLRVTIGCCMRKLSVQLNLFIVDSGCTNHMMGNLKLLYNFAEKYLGTVHFGNDQFALILGYGDLVQGNITINMVYYVEGLNYNIFSVGQFFDVDLEVAFWRSTCFVRDLQGNDLLTGNRGSDLYTVSLQETTSSTLNCFMAKALPTQAWLWHQRLSHLNFDIINLLSKKDIVIGLPKLKYVKDQPCSSCEASKAKRISFKRKAVPNSKGRLNVIYMDLCGPMRVASINGKEIHSDFLKMIQRNLQAQVIYVRTDRGTKFLNKTLNAYFKEKGIEHQTSTPRIPKQKAVVKRQNRTLVEAARMMLSELPRIYEKKIQLLMQGTSLTKQERECKLYDAFDKFTHIKGESLHQYYLIFTQLINDMNIYKMKMEQFQVNSKFLNSLPPEWSKLVTDVKLVKDLHTTNFDQLHAYLEQHELHANEVRLMRERNQDPLALVANQQMTPSHFNTYQFSSNNPRKRVNMF
nr:hypothetical protein [Tanacetum cinerariifolium]